MALMLYANREEQMLVMARILLRTGIVELRPDRPFEYAAGGRGPIYCDNRRLMGFPAERDSIADGLIDLIAWNGIEYDIIAGTATAGIPWASWVAYKLKAPMIYVRAAAKEHGKGNRIEGDIKEGQRVLLIEDLINSGASSVSSIEAIREAGGVVNHCLAIVTYGLPKAKEAFGAARCGTHALVGIETLLEVAIQEEKLTKAQCDMVRRWQRDPEGWYARTFGQAGMTMGREP